MDFLENLHYSLDTKRIYIGNDKVRFILGEPAPANNILVIGVNPSTADDKKDDPTIRRVRQFINSTGGIDGWIMVNPYPYRAAKVKKLPDNCNNYLVEENLRIINEITKKYNVNYVWAAWGSGIDQKEYLWECLYRLIRSLPTSLKWLSRPSLSKQGNVIHPFCPFGEVKLISFDIISHLRNKGFSDDHIDTIN